VDDLDGRILLNRILNISMVGCELDKFRQVMMVCFKYRTEPFVSIKCGRGGFVYLWNCYLLSSCGIVTFCLAVELLPFV